MYDLWEVILNVRDVQHEIQIFLQQLIIIIQRAAVWTFTLFTSSN